MVLQANVERTAQGQRVVLQGAIDAEFSKVAPFDGLTGVLVVDLGGVDRITSYGIRDWVEALKAAQTTYLAFVNVRPQLVAQFNMVSGFAAGGEVISLYMPYVCDECDHEEQVLIDLRSSYDVVQRGDPPPKTCPACQAEMEFDDLADSYFSHVASSPVPHPPPDAQAIIDGEVSTDGPRFEIRKEVEGEVTGIWISGPITKRVRFRRVLSGLEGQVVLSCSEVTRVDVAGQQRFNELAIQSPDYSLQLARVPSSLLSLLSDDFSGRVVSFMAPYQCKACGDAGALELSADGLKMLRVRKDVDCPACAKPVRPQLNAQAISRMEALVDKAPPPAVVNYLSGRAGPKETGRENRDNDESGRFNVLRRIGQGGMAEVFLALRSGPEGFEKKVVIKRILPQFCRDDQFVKMFLAEARTAARIDHPHVVQIFDLGSDSESYYIVMEYVRGWDLRTILGAVRRLERKFPIEFAARVTSDILAGLHAAHTLTTEQGKPAGIVHRDVSPHNVLISIDGAVKISDFGIARAIDEKDGGKPELRGKILYMAPEQVDHKRGPVNARSDVFAAGLVMYEALTGVVPYKREDKMRSLRAVLAADIPDPRSIRPDIPDGLADALLGALRPAQSDRYDTALSFQLKLESAMAAIGKPATPAHFSAYLKELRAEASEQVGDTSQPMNTPPSGSTSVTGNIDADLGNATLVDLLEPDGRDAGVLDTKAPTLAEGGKTDATTDLISFQKLKRG